MSDVHHEQESLIRTPKQLVVAVTGFFLVIVIGIILLVTFVTTERLTGAGSNGQDAEAISARVRPVAEAGFTLVDANAPKILQAGGAVYAAVCAACHDSGAAGAPKTGDVAGWKARLAQGYDLLTKHAIAGLGAMPPKGGNPDLDDIEVARAVAFMSNKSGANFKEPDAPAAPAVTPESVPAAGSDIAAASVPASPVASASAPTTLDQAMGKKIYDAACIACHGAGIAGAPKLGDNAAWAARIKQGSEVLYGHAIKGFQGQTGFMPPKGGSTASDAEIKAAVDYMVAILK